MGRVGCRYCDFTLEFPEVDRMTALQAFQAGLETGADISAHKVRCGGAMLDIPTATAKGA